MLEALAEFVLVGGLPEVVKTFVREGLPAAHRAQSDIVQAYVDDIPKYKNASESRIVQAVFAHIAQHAGDRFKYTEFVPGEKSAPKAKLAFTRI